MSTEINLGPELSALTGLARELAVRKVQVGLRDALPALVVNTAFPGVQVYVFVNCTGDAFTWQRTDDRHPIGDPSGAAEKIAAFVRTWNRTAAGGGVR